MIRHEPFKCLQLHVTPQCSYVSDVIYMITFTCQHLHASIRMSTELTEYRLNTEGIQDEQTPI